MILFTLSFFILLLSLSHCDNELYNVLLGGVQPGRFEIKGRKDSSVTVGDLLLVIIDLSNKNQTTSIPLKDQNILWEDFQFFRITYKDPTNKPILLEGKKIGLALINSTNASYWSGGFGVPSSNGMRFLVSSTIDKNSKSYIFEKISKLEVNFIMILGNLFQKPEDSDQIDTYIKRYDKYFFNNKKLYSSLSSKPLIYFFNDNDFAGKNSGAKSKGVNAINDAYRFLFPSYDLPDKGIYQKAEIGGAVFLMTDTRTFMDVDNKHFFGTEQTNWLKENFKNALESETIHTIIITVTQPWNYVDEEYHTDIIKQNFKSLSENIVEEKNVFLNELKDFNDKNPDNKVNFYLSHQSLIYKVQSLEEEDSNSSGGTQGVLNLSSDQIKSIINDKITQISNKLSKFRFKNILLLVGEKHLAFDTGKWNNYGGFPIAVAGPLDSSQQCRGGPYTHGSFHDARHQYLDISITDMAGQIGIKEKFVPSVVNYLKIQLKTKFCCDIDSVIDDNLKENVLPTYTNFAKLSETPLIPCVIVQGKLDDDKKKDPQIVFAYTTCEPEKFRGRLDRKCPMDWKEKFIHSALLLVAAIISSFFFFFFFYWQSVDTLTLHTEKIKTQ